MTAPRAAIAWTFAGLVIGLIAVGAYERSTHQEPEVIPQPPGWVAFSSQIRYIDSIENTTRVGHFHRGDDGSTRSDTGPSLSNITSIGIKNFSKAEFYLWSKEKGWTQQPMDVPPWGLSVP